MGECKLREDWLLRKDNNDMLISQWADKQSDNEIFCKICAHVISIQNKGFHAILQHANSSKHKKLCTALLGPNQLHLSLVHPNDFLNTASSSMPQSSATLQMFCSKDDVTVAELIWTMEAVSSNYSAASCQNLKPTFQAMFLNNTICKNFSLCPKKMVYLITGAIAPYFHDIIKEEVKSAFYTISFDETTNIKDKKELQITIRYWSDKKNEVVHKHLQTFLIGKADANMLHSKIISAINDSDLSLSRLLMIGSDGPNVNKKVFQLFNEDLIDIHSKGLADVGTCPIHIVHNAYLKGLEFLREDASELVIAVYHYFDGWPSRFEEYEQVQENLRLPNHKFVKHSPSRWLSFGTAAKRFIEQWEGIKYYFLKYIPSKKKNETMQATTYKKIASILRSSFIKAEIYFALSSADIFTKFTKTFQREEPLVHMLYLELTMLIHILIGRVCKSSVLDTMQKIGDIDVNSLFKDSNLLSLNDIVLSAEVRSELLKLNEKDKITFLKRAQSHYVTACKYSIEKALNSSKLIKALKCLHPEERKMQRSCRDIITVARALPLNLKEDVLLDEWKLLQHENDEPDSQSKRIDFYWTQFFNKLNAAGLPNSEISLILLKLHLLYLMAVQI